MKNGQTVRQNYTKKKNYNFHSTPIQGFPRVTQGDNTSVKDTSGVLSGTSVLWALVDEGVRVRPDRVGTKIFHEGPPITL